MTVDVVADNLGEGNDQATFVEWLVSEGSSVVQGDPLAELMTDKVNHEIVAPSSGTLAEQLVQPDDDVRLGQVIGKIEEC